jgi:hypothetical protein
MSDSRLKKNMEVIGADGVHIGTVARVENGKIKLTKVDSGEGPHKGHQSFYRFGTGGGCRREKGALISERGSGGYLGGRAAWKAHLSIQRQQGCSHASPCYQRGERIGRIPQAARPAVRTGRTSLLCLPGRGRCLRFRDR